MGVGIGNCLRSRNEHLTPHGGGCQMLKFGGYEHLTGAKK